ncbi:hypothetical protein [Undibacterium parvum]|uniref:Uncharacterized protein n=1 Tax=Undibacterium parvum TaxID=401471 RepID=A0A3Q9BR78_9BURK|nr:hypothetical protein [Undibacterium parvum]AZP12609.1 hypothetical protein EJN92_11715 [Undibacterium parvum]
MPITAVRIALTGFTSCLASIQNKNSIPNIQAGFRPKWWISLRLQLLSRSVYGEDRRYRYRALYSGATLLVEINFNKGGKLDYLEITPE